MIKVSQHMFLKVFFTWRQDNISGSAKETFYNISFNICLCTNFCELWTPCPLKKWCQTPVIDNRVRKHTQTSSSSSESGTPGLQNLNHQLTVQTKLRWNGCEQHSSTHFLFLNYSENVFKFSTKTLNIIGSHYGLKSCC